MECPTPTTPGVEISYLTLLLQLCFVTLHKGMESPNVDFLVGGVKLLGLEKLPLHGEWPVVRLPRQWRIQDFKVRGAKIM